MRDIADFRPEVRPFVGSCPTVIIDNAIRNAAIEFCDYTYTWREVLDAARVRDGVADYDIDAPANGRLVHVLYVAHSGVRVLPTTEMTLDTMEDGWRSSEAETAAYYYMPDRSTIRLSLTPTTSESRALEITATFKPTVDALVLPNGLYDDHREAISHGALMRLFDMDGEKWANPAAAEKRRALFDISKRKEKAARLNDYTRQSTLTIRTVNYYG